MGNLSSCEKKNKLSNDLVRDAKYDTFTICTGDFEEMPVPVPNSVFAKTSEEPLRVNTINSEERSTFRPIPSERKINGLNTTLRPRNNVITLQAIVHSAAQTNKSLSPDLTSITDSLQKLTLEEEKKKDSQKDFLKETQKQPKVLLRYEDGSEYCRVFKPLIKMEYEYSRREAQVRWEEGVIGVMVFFKIPKLNKDRDNEVGFGDKIKLIYVGNRLTKHWSDIGCVVKVPKKDNEEVCLHMERKKGAPFHLNSNFVWEFLWESTSYQRMKFALTKFGDKKSSVSEYLRNKLLGLQEMVVLIMDSLPEELSAPNLPKLNASQIKAVKNSLQNPISLIQGPPGTGKTATSATIVYHLVKSGKTPVLVCAQSNIAVDHLTEKIKKTGLKVVRMYSKRKEEWDSPIKSIALHRLVLESNSELMVLQKMKDEKKVLTKDQEKRYFQLKRNSEKSILSSVDVICCTCIGAGDNRLKSVKFQSILIDESVQATEPECIVPIVSGAHHLVLVGDHKQLSPVVMCKKADNGGLSQSLFERLLLLGVRPFLLETQYRMHPFLSKFSSKQFYKNSLKDGVSSEDRKIRQIRTFWPNVNKPMFFYCCSGPEQRDGSGTSYINKMEASYVERLISHLRSYNIRYEQIGVITPYEGQRAYLVNYLKSNRRYHPKLEVASVNAFQGREKDLIIFSCVRSNKERRIGFLNDPRRLNVALTRARYGLIVVGNPRTISKDPLWKDFLIFCKSNNVLVEGKDLKKLIPSNFQIN